MSRYPPTPTHRYSEEYRPYAEYQYKGVSQAFGENGSLIIYKNEDDALIGPFPIQIASKEVGHALSQVILKFATLQSIPNDAKETAILVIGARFETRYELYAHTLLAIKQAGMTAQQVDSIRVGKKPDGLSTPASVAYDASYHLANKPGALPQDLYDACVRVLGKEGTLLMVHYAGLYAYMCILMNAVDTPLPPGET